MKKLEPGMLCRFVQPGSKHDGVAVTVIEPVGALPEHEYIAPPGVRFPWGDYWRVDRPLESPNGKCIGPFARACRLQPINPDHQPADEEWQADFKRLLSDQPLATERKHA